MRFSDYLISGLLLLVVVRQLRRRELSVVSLVWPLGLIAWALVDYLPTVPVHGPSGALVAGCISLGAVLGVGCALTTRITRARRKVLVQATGAAVALWLAGMSSRLAFGLYADHGGADVIGRFSAAHGITNPGAWPAALLLMALAEVASRTVVLAIRWRRITSSGSPCSQTPVPNQGPAEGREPDYA